MLKWSWLSSVILILLLTLKKCWESKIILYVFNSFGIHLNLDFLHSITHDQAQNAFFLPRPQWKFIKFILNLDFHYFKTVTRAIPSCISNTGPHDFQNSNPLSTSKRISNNTEYKSEALLFILDQLSLKVHNYIKNGWIQEDF